MTSEGALEGPLLPTPKSPLHPGTAFQLREHVPTNSTHVLVYPDGSWTSHVDKVNPDYGAVAAVVHGAVDVLKLPTRKPPTP